MEEAIVYYKKYLVLNPAAVQAWLDLTHCYAQLEQWDEAIQTSKNLLGRKPDHPSAMYNLGALYANQNKPEEARRWWEKVKAQQQDPDLAQKAIHSLLRLDMM